MAEKILNVKQIKKRVGKLDSERKTWEDHWQELADYMLPRKNEVTQTQHRGQKRNVQIVDNTGVQSLQLLAGSLQGLLTSPSLPWFELTTGSLELDQDDEIRIWLQKTNRQMLNIINNSNFQTEVHELYIDLCLFGTAAMSIEEDEESVIRFKTHFIRDVFIRENNKGFVDEVYRKFKWPARSIIAEFGMDNVGKKVRDAFEKNHETEFEIIQAIYPRDIEDMRQGRQRYISQWVLPAEDIELRQSGFNEFPFVVPRWSKATGETYGRSPGIAALPEVKTINAMAETVIKGAQKVVDPPLQLPDDSFIMPIRTRPGSLNFYRSGSPDRIQPVFADTRLDFGFQSLAEKRQRIREAFFVDQLQLQQGPQMTATEVLQRTEEKMRLLGPMLGRMQSEFLRPMIDRIFEVMIRTGAINLDEVPEGLRNRTIDVQFSSVVARSQKMSEGQNILRFIESAIPFAQFDPKVLDNLDGDAALIFLSRIFNVPQEIIRDRGQVDKIRDAKLQQEQAAAQAAQQQQQADMVQKVGPSLVAAGQQQG